MSRATFSPVLLYAALALIPSAGCRQRCCPTPQPSAAKRQLDFGTFWLFEKVNSGAFERVGWVQSSGGHWNEHHTEKWAIIVDDNDATDFGEFEPPDCSPTVSTTWTLKFQCQPYQADFEAWVASEQPHGSHVVFLTHDAVVGPTCGLVNKCRRELDRGTFDLQMLQSGNYGGPGWVDVGKIFSDTAYDSDHREAWALDGDFKKMGCTPGGAYDADSRVWYPYQLRLFCSDTQYETEQDFENVYAPFSYYMEHTVDGPAKQKR